MSLLSLAPCHALLVILPWPVLALFAILGMLPPSSPALMPMGVVHGAAVILIMLLLPRLVEVTFWPHLTRFRNTTVKLYTDLIGFSAGFAYVATLLQPGIFPPPTLLGVLPLAAWAARLGYRLRPTVATC